MPTQELRPSAQRVETIPPLVQTILGDLEKQGLQLDQPLALLTLHDEHGLYLPIQMLVPERDSDNPRLREHYAGLLSYQLSRDRFSVEMNFKDKDGKILMYAFQKRQGAEIGAASVNDALLIDVLPGPNGWEFAWKQELIKFDKPIIVFANPPSVPVLHHNRLAGMRIIATG